MAQDWNDYADRIQKQLPAAPEPLLDGYVNWVPWIYMIFGAIGLVFAVLFLLLGAALSPIFVLTGMVGSGLQVAISLIVLLVGSVLGIAGGYGMMQRKLTGWWLVAIGLTVNALASLFSAHLLNVLFLVAVAYLHLSVKPRYS